MLPMPMPHPLPPAAPVTSGAPNNKPKSKDQKHHLGWDRGADSALGRGLREAGPWFFGGRAALLGLQRKPFPQKKHHLKNNEKKSPTGRRLASIAIRTRVRRRGKKLGLTMHSRWDFSTLDRKVETHPSRANRAYRLLLDLRSQIPGPQISVTSDPPQISVASDLGFGISHAYHISRPSRPVSVSEGHRKKATKRGDVRGERGAGRACGLRLVTGESGTSSVPPTHPSGVWLPSALCALRSRSSSIALRLRLSERGLSFARGGALSKSGPLAPRPRLGAGRWASAILLLHIVYCIFHIARISHIGCGYGIWHMAYGRLDGPWAWAWAACGMWSWHRTYGTTYSSSQWPYIHTSQ
jgi:hypothetical protein